ncbi:MAG TPA: IclR family transcriptional regulator [Blastococcus sp.]|nr:IclR family transcriptional regulator [Blastococcus sp.]
MARSGQPKGAGKPQRAGDGVQSVERALELLEALAEPGEAKGVSELARATGLPVATIHRLLATMVSRGYVRQDSGSHKYTLGSHLIRLGEAAARDFGQFARPYLAELMEASGETANLAMLEDGHVAYVAQVASRHHRVRMFTEVGRRVHPHTSGVGKVVLAFRPRAEVEALLARSGLPPRTPRTITDPARFLAELDKVASQGYAIDSGEEEVGVRCLAVPVFGMGGSVAAMSVSAPEGRLQDRDIERVLPEMLRISAALSAAFLTGAGPSPRSRVDGDQGRR